MSFLSIRFLLFVIALVVVYYLVPKRFQWIVLLIASTVFYAFAGLFGCFFILLTATTVYAGARLLQHLADTQRTWLKEHKAELSKEERNAYKAGMTRKKRIVLTTVLVINFGVLCLFKYFDFGDLTVLGFSWIIPLGISFYTFQSTGYLVDVYWENVPAEPNYFKMLLFVSFFPQITQGPISVYEDLSAELFKEHAYSYENFSRGARRVVWGCLKKLMIAEFLAPYVREVFAHYPNYPGYIALLGAFGYSVQIYADFSGYMDIACGVSRILGIRLTENFDRPYFSKSVAEYWRRWHISLGTWFKRYIYYPVAMARWNKKLGKTAVAKMGKGFGRNLPAAIALVATWAATGIWHGNTAGYIVWGLLNGIFIIVSLWTDPVFTAWKKKHNIDEAGFPWRAFVTLRTFALVTFIKVLPEVGTLTDGLKLWKHAFWELNLHNFGPLFPAISDVEIFHVKIALLFTVVLFVSSLLQRRRPLYRYVEKVPLVLRAVLLAGVVLMIVGYGIPEEDVVGGFLYARF